MQCPDDKTPLFRACELLGADADPMVGKTLDGRYTLLAKLGAGSMGAVYRARQHTIGRNVAVKILRSDRALDETSKARFLREARANSLLTSPNTVTVFDFGQSELGELYLAMELLEGESLGQRLAREKRLPVDVAVEATRQALRSLAEAHAKGIIHRDLKPDNLFFARVIQGEKVSEHAEVVKVLDFGIAKMLRADGELPMSVVETQAGTVFGTPRYMSPEQAQGKRLDLRSDLYSLGVILYQMLTGRPCFTDTDAIVVMARHIKTMPKPPSEACPEAHIPPDLEAALMRALAKDPKGRPANAEAMSQELARALDLVSAVTTSGVRSSLTGSVPPPPRAQPHQVDLGEDPPGLAAAPLKTRARAPMIALSVLLTAALALAIFALLERGKARDPSVITRTVTAGQAAAPAPAAPSSSGAIDLDLTPAVSPDSLPRASARPTAPAQGARPAPKAPRPPAAGPAPRGSGSPYGLFE